MVQVKGLGFSFHESIQALMSSSSAFTEVWTPRRMSLSVSRPNHWPLSFPAARRYSAVFSGFVITTMTVGPPESSAVVNSFSS